MPKGSGSPGQAISLPKGGGALRGIGETFSPDLYTGTGSLTVPLAIPPGRNGLQPDLKLVYSSGNGNGPYGLGWGLSVAAIRRKTAKGVPRYDGGDVFLLSGAEDLVLVEDASTESLEAHHHRHRYRPRSEGLFARIEHHRLVDKQQGFVRADYWEVCNKDGLTSIYGTRDRPPGAGPNWLDPATVADPGDRDRIFAWQLTETRDPFGNRIVYEYERDSAETKDHHWDQLYLKRVRYVDFTGDQGREEFLVSVTFHYQDRPDPFSHHRSGFEIRTRRRCTAIETVTHAGEARRAHSYGLQYLDQRDDLEDLDSLLPLNKVSLLHRVTVTGHDGDEHEALPPLEFGYTRFEPNRRDLRPVRGHLPAQALSSPALALVDLFGNGLPDVVEIAGSARYWRNLGEGRFDLPREMPHAPAGFFLADPGVQLIDGNGNGRLDLMVSANGGQGLAGCFPMRFDGLWDRRSFQRQRAAPSFGLEDPEVKLLDLSGDGVTDAIRSGARLDCFFQDAKEGWSATRRVERGAIDGLHNVSFSDPRLKWADLSGDGLQDMVLVHSGSVEYWPNLGHGDWGKRVQMQHGPRLPHGYDPARILLGDVDGDGLADLVYVDDSSITLWINQSGNAWSEPIEIQGTPPVSNMDAVRLVDLLGSGVGGVLWSGPGGTPGRPRTFFHDFTGGLKPYLLKEMDNHLGALTRVEYAPSTAFYVKDWQRPRTRWQTPLPFPVHVVARIEILDQISGGKATAEFSYHHGYWDGAEREFRGFGRVDQRDSQVFETYHGTGLHGSGTFQAVQPEHFSPPLETRSWFHQGPIGDDFGKWSESDLSGEFWAGDPQMLDRPPALNELLKHLPRRARRDALRSLRGQKLRSELYALDGTSRQDRPYTVSESLFGCSAVVESDRHSTLVDDATRLPAGWPGDGRQPIFFGHAQAQRTTQWERGDDPMTRFRFTGDYDAYGQPRREADIACPRGWRRPEDVPGLPYLAALSTKVYARPPDNHTYIQDRVAKTTTYEIKNTGQQRALQLMDTPEDSPSLTLTGQVLAYYDGEAFTGLPSGQVGPYGAQVRGETLILTDEIVDRAYWVKDHVERPACLNADGTVNLADAYPQELSALLAARRALDPTRPGLAMTPAGYGYAAGGYWAATQRQAYDFQLHTRGVGRGLVCKTRDELGNETAVEYDAYDLLPVRITDPAGLVTRTAYDYRLLKPRQVTGPNGNRTAYAYSPLGLLRAQAVMGKENEQVGDTLHRPGASYAYDLSAFDRQGQPISARVTKRVYHAYDNSAPAAHKDDTIETVQYSDGFGRLIQTRLQAEDLAFGPLEAGGNLLPEDQTAQAATTADIVGQKQAAGQPPRVVVSGWQIHDNKGRVVVGYEPFFSSGWTFAPPAEAQLGAKVTTTYDPRGHSLRVVSADDSEERIVFGQPADLADPETYAPSPWETYRYDSNDNAGRTHPGTAESYKHHWNTPTSQVVDALGRTIAATERNGPDPNTDWYTTRSEYDIRGNLLAVRDALGRLVFQHAYDLTPQGNEGAEPGEEESGPQMLRLVRLDGGVERLVFDAAGNEIERRDNDKGTAVLQAYDSLHRPVRLWAQDNKAEALTLRERTIYGDSPDAGLTPDEVRARNLAGQTYHQYDEAGLLSFEAYDLKGSPLEEVRRVIRPSAILAAFDPPPADWQVPVFRVDWQPTTTTFAAHVASMLDGTGYRTSTRYDALGRATGITYPRDVEGGRRVLKPAYNRAGALKAVDLDGETYVRQIAYNARGQRTLIAYGNGLMSRTAYDPCTLRPVRLRSEAYANPAPDTYRPAGRVLQDLAYERDLAGNCLRIVDRTPGSGVRNNPQAARIRDAELASLVSAGNALVRWFTYDPLHRLTSATGRECKDIPRPRPWADKARGGFGNGNHGTPNQGNAPDLSAAYAEDYAYDPVGNLTSMRHRADGGAWTRHFGIGGLSPAAWRAGRARHLSDGNWEKAPNNKVTYAGADDQAANPTHIFDSRGNMVSETTSRHFEWDHSDRLRAFYTQTPGAEPSLHAHYLYDGDGQRVMKVIRKTGHRVELTVYAGDLFEHHQIVQAGQTRQNNTLHVMDDRARIATLRVGAPIDNDNSPPRQYHLADLLGSSTVVVDGQGAWINREEYLPYGETSFGSYGRKRYRFSGKERDEESGLNYHDARYLALHLGRFLSIDPEANLNPYWYADGNPLRWVDTTGTSAQDRPDAGADANRGYEGGGLNRDAGVPSEPEGPPPLQKPSKAEMARTSKAVAEGLTTAAMIIAELYGPGKVIRIGKWSVRVVKGVLQFVGKRAKTVARVTVKLSSKAAKATGEGANAVGRGARAAAVKGKQLAGQAAQRGKQLARRAAQRAKQDRQAWQSVQRQWGATYRSAQNFRTARRNQVILRLLNTRPGKLAGPTLLMLGANTTAQERFLDLVGGYFGKEPPANGWQLIGWALTQLGDLASNPLQVILMRRPLDLRMEYHLPSLPPGMTCKGGMCTLRLKR